MSTNDADLIRQYIELNPDRAGLDEARLKDYAIAVWALIGYLRGTNGDIDRVAADYEVPREAVQAAIAYYERHRALLDHRIAVNNGQVFDLLQPA
jgi:uncharacterized protein (DUF433 family)